MPVARLAKRNILRNRHDYLIYFLTLVIGVAVFYAFNSIVAQEQVLQLSDSQMQIVQLLGQLIGGVSFFFAIALGFLMIYASGFLVRRRKREFAIYLLLGMPKRKVAAILLVETAVVGIAALAVGLLLGIALSQAMLYITSALFAMQVEGFAFVFSGHAALMTLLCFAVVFIAIALFNSGSITRFKLIDLLNANRVSQRVKIRSIGVSVAIFLVSIGFLATAYALFLKRGFESGPFFIEVTVLLVIGTFGFFFSSSGFLLRVFQGNRKHYLKNLNMFTLRQINSRVNTAFISITFVCLALFLAITATCGGFSINRALNDSLRTSTPFDATVTLYPVGDSTVPDLDIAQTLRDQGPRYDSLIEQSVQIDFHSSAFTPRQLDVTSGYTPSSIMETGTWLDEDLPAVSISQLNALRAMRGEAPLALADDEFGFWCDMDMVHDLYSSYLATGEGVTVGGVELHASSWGVVSDTLQTRPINMNSGVIVVPDAVADMLGTSETNPSILDMMYDGSREECEPAVTEMLDNAENALGGDGGYVLRYQTALSIYTQQDGLSVLISYLAIYIGAILLILCGAILALQQLFDVADNAPSYKLLRQLGATRSMVSSAVFKQISVYFFFPLVLGLAHSIVALYVVTDVVKVFGQFDIVQPLATTLILTLVVYGGYFLITYLTARSVIDR